MPLNKNEVEEFKLRLEKLKAQLTNTLLEVSHDVRSSVETKGYSQHQADEGTDDFVRTVSLEVSNKESSILKQVERALEKVSEGNYGVCDISGDDIPKKRLDAIPYATMTVAAQEKLEQGLL
jgi:DnaK suppressor protein